MWGTVGVSENIIEASWIALVDSFEYKLCKDEADTSRKASPRQAGEGRHLTSQRTSPDQSIGWPARIHVSVARH